VATDSVVDRMSKPEGEFVRLAIYEGLTAEELTYKVHADTDTFVYFIHRCATKNGQHDRVGYVANYDNTGLCHGTCCAVDVPPEVWTRWQRMSELERRIVALRQEPTHVE